MDPDKVVLNDNYRKRQVDKLMQVAKVLASDECMCAHVERLIGNLDRIMMFQRHAISVQSAGMINKEGKRRFCSNFLCLEILNGWKA